MKITKSELKEMIREALREELNSEKSLTEARVIKWTRKEAPTEAYAVLTDDGPFANEVFLSWDPNEQYYTTVDEISEVNKFDCPATAREAEDRALQAQSSTLGGWEAPMHIIKITNFIDAYFNGEEPEYTIVKTI